jgi:hypothetical protein
VATPDDTSTRRLRLVGNEHRQGAAAIPEDELTAGQAAAFAATVAEVNHSPIVIARHRAGHRSAPIPSQLALIDARHIASRGSALSCRVECACS